ncbi:MAG TPA: altronate dehydratase family protein [Quisquiliibacterium sp.]|nr:altronate dehydratase family protein [Quisquiliibacterium sp.]HQN12044.1 altronate dehydratase family protein [Quisquiliibacterium sp.]
MSSATVSLIRRPTLRLNPNDDVVIAARPLAAGTRIDTEGVTCVDAIPAGHKVAVRAVAKGSPVKRYDQIIGFATQDIAPGQHVHTHNLAFETFARDYAVGVDVRPTPAPATQATFMGIRRADGRVATRNYIGVISTVNCSASVSKYVAAHFTPERLAQFPNVDGVVPITHSSGCGMASTGAGIDVLRRTIAGYCRHPNFAGVVIIGLGCEANQMDSLFLAEQMHESALLKPLIIQTSGGTRKTVEAGIAAVNAMLPTADAVRREPMPASHITIGLQCGGSDGYSGITANPALGAACDLLVAHGGTVILSETPEIYGAEHLLTRRAVSQAVADKLIARIRWWEDYTARNDGSMDNNPSPGNKAGGLTTILEKSLGAVAKAGTTNLVDVAEYAEPVTARGFVFMDTPGYDPVSATGQVAGGANLICFTTGRGSVYGCKPAPSIKLATNSALYERMTEDMDINCGEIVDGTVSVQQKGQEIFELILRVASGEATCSEALGMGNDEFVPWTLGATM